MAERKSAPGMTKFYGLLGLVAVAGAVAVWLGTRGNAGGGAAEPVDLGAIDDQELVDRAMEAAEMGDPNATVTILEFGDYQCPACRDFASFVKPQIDLAYIETGIAKFQYRDLPLVASHPHAFLAARASWCADDQGQYWPYHDALFESQRDWAGATNAARRFNDLAEELDLDSREFRSCLASDRHAERVTANRMLAERYGVGGTPTVIVQRGDDPPMRLSSAGFPAIQKAVEADSLQN